MFKRVILIIMGVCVFIMSACNSNQKPQEIPSTETSGSVTVTPTEDLSTSEPTPTPTYNPTTLPPRDLPESNEFFSQIYKKGYQTADGETLSLLDRYAQQMRDNVLNSKSEYEVAEGATVYYFADNGSNLNNGLSPDKPKRDFYPLNNNLELKEGDVVLFKRGDTFRGTFPAKSGVTYSAYGEGAKPIICGSLRDYADAKLWQETEYKNVYLCTVPINNAGNIIFNNSRVLGDYTQTLGKLQVLNLNDFSGVQDLNNDLDFHCDLENKKLYLYSTEGNPGDRFDSIDICEAGNLINIRGKKDIVIDNIHFTLGGSHAVGAVNANNLTVRNCLFDWIGGSVQHGTTRFGNAVESYVGSDGFYVYNNWIYQIYDTGITTQYAESPEDKLNVMRDNVYYNNIIEYCFWAFEYFHRMSEGVQRYTEDIYIYNNYCRMSGEGWGRPGAGYLCSFPSYGEEIKNVVIEHNIFDRGNAFLVSAYGSDASEFTYNENIYVQEKGGLIARLKNTNYRMDDNAYKTFTELVNDKEACVFCVVK